MPYPQSYALHALDASDEFLDGIIELDIFVAFFGDLVVGMDDRGMIPAAKAAADLGQRGVGELAAEIHGNLPGEGKVARPFLGKKIIDIDLEVGRDDLLDDLQCDLLGLIGREDILEGLGYEFGCNRLMVQGGVGNDPCKSTFKLTDICIDAARDIDHDIIRYIELFKQGLFLEDGDTCFEIRCLDISDESPFKAGTQAIFQRLDFPRRTITRENDMLIGIVQGVEGMEEFLLRMFLFREELNIIDEQYIDIAIFLAEGLRITITDGIDELIGEFFTGDV